VRGVKKGARKKSNGLGGLLLTHAGGRGGARKKDHTRKKKKVNLKEKSFHPGRREENVLQRNRREQREQTNEPKGDPKEQVSKEAGKSAAFTFPRTQKQRRGGKFAQGKEGIWGPWQKKWKGLVSVPEKNQKGSAA